MHCFSYVVSDYDYAVNEYQLVAALALWVIGAHTKSEKLLKVVAKGEIRACVVRIQLVYLGQSAVKEQQSR